MDGYGNDTTAQPDNTAAAIAQIFSTGVTAYVDSQAIQRGYQINNPQYYQSGYPAGQGVGYYSPTTAGQGVSASLTGSSNTMIYLVLAGVVLYFLMKK